MIRALETQKSGEDIEGLTLRRELVGAFIC